mgnify:CR=1 FL=1
MTQISFTVLDGSADNPEFAGDLPDSGAQE